MHDLTPDEIDILAVLRRAQQHGNADVRVTFQSGVVVKRWITLKGEPRRSAEGVVYARPARRPSVD